MQIFSKKNIMIRLSKQVFQKSLSISSLEYLHHKNKPTDIEIFSYKPTQKPPQKPSYEDECKPNPDYNQDYYNDKKCMLY